MTGIVSYGTYIPRFRVRIAEIASLWRKQEREVLAGIGVSEKSVAGVDEDAVSLAVAAAADAIRSARLKPADIGAMLIGSESHPYAVKPSSAIAGEILGISGNYFAADLEFACKAGTAGVRLMLGLVGSNGVEYGIAIGSDTAQAKPGDILECTAGSAAAAYIIGKKNVIAEVIATVSYTTDTPDFWRRDGQKYPSHGARFTGEPAYFTHVSSASKMLLEKTHTKPSDFTYAIFHMPNGKFPKVIANKLGFTEDQILPGFIVDKIGNPYSASVLTGLAATLDIARAGDSIFLCSYGSGAGSDAFFFRVTEEIKEYRKNQTASVATQIAQKEYIDYMELFKRQIVKNTI